MTIEAAIADLQSKALALAGMKQAPAAPVEAMLQFPFSIAYERSGATRVEGPTWGHDLATIVVEFHVGRQILPKAIEQAMALRDPFLKAIIADPNLGGAISAFNNEGGPAIRRQFGRLQWGDIETIGYRFEIDVKVSLTA